MISFSIAEINELLPYEGDVPISCNQIEVHPWLPQTELVDFAKKHNIVTSCYSPFAGQKADGATLLKDEKVNELAKKNDMDVGQLLQSWAVQRGTVPLGKSATPQRIKSNLAIRKLSDEDMRTLDGMAQPGDEGRTVDFRYVELNFFNSGLLTDSMLRYVGRHGVFHFSRIDKLLTAFNQGRKCSVRLLCASRVAGISPVVQLVRGSG